MRGDTKSVDKRSTLFAETADASPDGAIDSANDCNLARRRRLLEAPIARTVLGLAAPTILGSFALMTANIVQMHFIGRLGVDALAGVTLAFPCLTLMQIIASAGIGAGVASAVARSLGAGNKMEADALVLNAAVLAMVVGVAFAVIHFLIGPTLYLLLGGTGSTLASSIAYANWIFGASAFFWVLSLLNNALIGSGNMFVPQALAVLSLLVIPLSPALMFGWGPFPRLGVAGGGLAYACYYVLAVTVLVCYLLSARAPIRLRLDPSLIQWRFLHEILRVGGPAALSSAIPTLNVALITAAVARFGDDAVAGYGIAVRTDYLLLPIYLSVAAGVLPMVGANVGAGQIFRARRIAWTGAFVAASIASVAAIALALASQTWLGLFSKDPAVIASGSLYFLIAGIQFPLSAAALILSAAAQGAGQPLWPLAAIISRFVIATGGAWLIVAGLGGTLEAVFAVLAMASALYCGVIATGQLSGRTIRSHF